LAAKAAATSSPAIVSSLFIRRSSLNKADILAWSSALVSPRASVGMSDEARAAALHDFAAAKKNAPNASIGSKFEPVAHPSGVPFRKITCSEQRSIASAKDLIFVDAGGGSSITGKSEPDGINGAFCAKAAIHSWAKGLSREVGKHGITVNCIASDGS
jgi:NAD(P)-dependent dehydrogenase (short-subunit alcohol dehydrogenase family)